MENEEKITRTIQNQVLEDLESKIVLLTGPRQVGKTTLSKCLLSSFEYLNFDGTQDYKVIQNSQWSRDVDLVILDELHKKKEWKLFLKGIFDTEGVRPRLLVTGSARLDTFSKVGDSLAGRHFLFHLFPLDLNELSIQDPSIDIDKGFEKLLDLGGFPEPYLKGSKKFYNRWKKTHLDVILREDLTNLINIKNLKSMEVLIDLLSERVGGQINYSSLARDLEVDAKTVKNWIEILEKLYIIFRITPYSKNIARSILKNPKVYFYDLGKVKNGRGAKLENLVALSLKKRLHFLEEVEGVDNCSIHYLRTKDGQEVDFFVEYGSKQMMIEVKSSDVEFHSGFHSFGKISQTAQKIQLVAKLTRELENKQGVKIKKMANWLAALHQHIS